MGIVVDKGELERLCRLMHQENRTIVTTNGCFDILHVGHVRILKQARALGDILIVGLNSDGSVRRLKGPERPINSEHDRAEVLSSLACVDYVYVFTEDTPVEFIRSVKPDIHVKGADYKPANLAETTVVESLGGRVEILALVPEKSTTNLVAKIREQSDRR